MYKFHPLKIIHALIKKTKNYALYRYELLQFCVPLQMLIFTWIYY